MKVSDVLQDLVYGELSSHALAYDGQIGNEELPKVLAFVNAGLIALYTRYPLMFRQLTLVQRSWITEYVLKPENARTTRKDGYIYDTKRDPFKEPDVVRVVSISDENGDVLERNDTGHDKVYLLPSPDIIEIPNPCDSNALFVIYQALHPRVTSREDDILLPAYLLPALYAFVGQRAYSGTSSQEHVSKAAELLARYESICSQMELQGLVNMDANYENRKPYLGGWV